MSISKMDRINGRATKRQKTSHESDEALSESETSSDDTMQDGEEEHLSDQASDASAVDEPSHSRRQRSRNPPNGRVHRPVTANGASMSSSAMMMRTQALLDEARPDYALRLKKSKLLVDKIIKIIKAIPEQQPMSFAQVQTFSQKTLRVTVPWCQMPTVDIKYKFQYSTPSRITTEGPLVHHLSSRDDSRITIVPEMPASIFQDKDYLNHRCLHKRSFYLACIAAAIHKNLGTEFNAQFAFSSGNSLLPILQIKPKGDLTHSSISLFEVNPSFPSSVGPPGKMTPFQNCIRKHDLGAAEDDGSRECTPLYNSTVRHLSSTRQFHDLIEDAASKADNFRDACLLGTIWLRHKAFSSDTSQGGFGLQEWSSMCALLLQSGGHQGRPLFSPRYSTVQLFKAMLQVLSSRDMHDPFVVRGHMDFSDHGSLPIFYDAVTGVNLLYKMTPWSYSKLKKLAASSLADLNSRKSASFDAALVMDASNPILQYDELYELDPSQANSKLFLQEERLYDILKKGLGDRAKSIDLILELASPWKITSSAPRARSSKVTLGILVNAETSRRLVDHGPSVDEKAESELFRSFWGEKAELRKFKDGRISESLVWTSDVPVTRQIIQHLCARHLNLPPSSVHASPSLPQLQLRSSVSAEEAFVAVNNSFQSLSSTLHHLDGLPVPIRSVSAASEALRSSSLISSLEPGIAQPIDVVLQFDTSGRWPDNLQAIQYTKIAFLTKIGDLLLKKDRKLEVRVGIENTSASGSGVLNTSFLDVINQPPAANIPPIIFRIRIYHERELHLLQQALSDKSLRPQTRESYQSGLQYLKQRFLANPSHTNAFRSLMTQFQPLSATIRLLKSWISAHGLSQHIPPEALEVIAAHVFLSPAPWSVPGTSTTAFTRCLQFLGQWDWSTQPLIADLSPSRDMTPDQHTDLETRFAAWRQMDPNMNTVTWFIGTNLDGTGVVWTQGTGGTEPKPPRVVAGRVTALASAAVSLLTAKSLPNSTLPTSQDWTDIFTTSPAAYDFILHLHPPQSSSGSGHAAKKTSTEFKNLLLAPALNIDTTCITDLASYLEDLTRSFGHVAIFFPSGGDGGTIGGLWRPHIRTRDARPWKIRLGVSTAPVSAGECEDACEVNHEGMLAEMGAMGAGLVRRITVRDGE